MITRRGFIGSLIAIVGTVMVGGLEALGTPGAEAASENIWWICWGPDTVHQVYGPGLAVDAYEPFQRQSLIKKAHNHKP